MAKQLISLVCTIVDESAIGTWRTNDIRFFKSDEGFIALHNAPSMKFDEVKVVIGSKGRLSKFLSNGKAGDMAKYRHIKVTEVSMSDIDINNLIYMESQ